MKLIAVNISQTLPTSSSVLIATSSAWKLKHSKFSKHKIDFVIGVASGNIFGYYRMKTSSTTGGRVSFSLINCTPKEKSAIDSFTKNKNIK